MNDLFRGQSQAIGLSNAQSQAQSQANQAALYRLGKANFGAAMTRQARGIYGKSLLEDNFDIYMKECDKTLESEK